MLILIAEDHSLMADALEIAIKNAMECEQVYKVYNGQALLQQYIQAKPHLILLDIFLPQLDGIMATRQLRQHDGQVTILAMSMYGEKEVVQQVLSAGANGFFDKRSPMSELLKAIGIVLDGKKYVDPHVLDSLLVAPPERIPEFTPQELRVLSLLAQGYNSEEIAKELYISVATAKYHRTNLLQKSGKKNVAQLIHWATKNRIV